MWSKLLTSLALAAVAVPPASGQAATDPSLGYRREVFQYRREGRPDPFRSLLKGADLGVRAEDLSLVGIVYQPQAGRSVAVLVRRGVDRPIRARVGERIGGLRIVAIRPRSVDVVVEEFGIARRASIELRAPQRKGEAQ